MTLHRLRRPSHGACDGCGHADDVEWVDDADGSAYCAAACHDLSKLSETWRAWLDSIRCGEEPREETDDE